MKKEYDVVGRIGSMNKGERVTPVLVHVRVETHGPTGEEHTWDTREKILEAARLLLLEAVEKMDVITVTKTNILFED